MRLFQNSGIYPGYLPRLTQLTQTCTTFAQARDAFLADRFGACHFLQPVLNGDPQAFFTNGDDEPLQRRWAAEQGMPAMATLDEILLAQVEHHRTEVFYNLDPMRYGSTFVRRLPSCVKRAIAWRAAPSPGADFGAYHYVVCNFPSILRSYEERGWRAAWFEPAHDPVMDEFGHGERTIDIVFVGGYSRHHRRRAEVLERVAAFSCARRVVFHLDRSRLTRLAESLPGRLLPLGEHRRPRDIRRVSAEPVFGRDLYRAIGSARIVLNGAVDMAGEERGNMRCFEAMGCGALLVSDAGRYPEGMEDGRTLLTYRDPQDAVAVIERALAESEQLACIAHAGREKIAHRYSKARQWDAFVRLAS